MDEIPSWAVLPEDPEAKERKAYFEVKGANNELLVSTCPKAVVLAVLHGCVSRLCIRDTKPCDCSHKLM
jgi:hypothetical protein